MNWTLEVILVPVTDVDRAKEHYGEQLGFNVVRDLPFGEMTDSAQTVTPRVSPLETRSRMCAS